MPDNEYTIMITQQDIDIAVRGQPDYCVYSTAIGRQIPEATYISVDVKDIRFTLGGKRFGFPSPPEVGPYVLAWDAGDHAGIKPTTLHLANPMITDTSAPHNPRRLIAKAQRPVTTRPRRSLIREFGKRAYRVNPATIDDHLAEYERIRGKHKARRGGKVNGI